MKKIKCPNCQSEIELFEDLFQCFCSHCGTKVIVSEATVLEETYKFQFLSKEKAEFNLVTNPNDLNSLLSLCLQEYGFYMSSEGVKCFTYNEKSIYEQEYYLKLMEIADEKEKEEINKYVTVVNNLQNAYKNKISSLKPYDVFLCYCNDRNINDNLIDRQIAEKLYVELTNCGYRTFLEDIKVSNADLNIKDCLVDKALSESKVMILIGSNIKFINRDDVSSKYKKYISLITPENGKKLVTCFKDILAFDFPVDLVSFESFDMNKPTVKLELFNYIDNVFNNSLNYNSPNYNENNGILTKEEAIAKHIDLLIEDKNYNSAKQLINHILTSNPKLAICYLYLLFIEYKITSIEELEALDVDLRENDYLNKAIFYENNKEFKSRLENIKLNSMYKFQYKVALDYLKYGLKDDAVNVLNTINEFEEAKVLLEQLDNEKAEAEQKLYYENIINEFSSCTSIINFDEEKFNSLVEKYQETEDEKILEIVNNFKLVVEQTKIDIEENEVKLQKQKELYLAKKKRNKIITIIVLGASLIAISITLLFTGLINPMMTKNSGIEALKSNNYTSAMEHFAKLDNDEGKKLYSISYELDSMNNFNEISVWAKNIENISKIQGTKVIINYNVNGKVTSVETENFINFNNSFKVDGYDLIGWKLGTYNFDVDTLTLTVDVKAILYKNTYEVSYHLNGGKVSGLPTKYNISFKDIVINTPTKEGYDFIGWTDNKNTTTPTKSYKFNYFGDGLVLTANWSPKNIKVNLFHEDKLYKTLDLKYGDKLDLKPVSESFNGQKFVGWYYNKDGKQCVVNSIKLDFITDGSVDLYPIYVTEYYKINYELNGGINDKSNPSSISTEMKACKLYNPTRDGYEFSGWTYGDITTPTKYLMIYPETLSSDITVVAHWVPLSNV